MRAQPTLHFIPCTGQEAILSHLLGQPTHSNRNALGGDATGIGGLVGALPMAHCTLVSFRVVRRGDHSNRRDEVLGTPLLRFDLKHASCFLADVADLAALFDRQGHRLLADRHLSPTASFDWRLACQ